MVRNALALLLVLQVYIDYDLWRRVSASITALAIARAIAGSIPTHDKHFYRSYRCLSWSRHLCIMCFPTPTQEKILPSGHRFFSHFSDMFLSFALFLPLIFRGNFQDSLGRLCWRRGHMLYRCWSCFMRLSTTTFNIPLLGIRIFLHAGEGSKTNSPIL